MMDLGLGQRFLCDLQMHHSSGRKKKVAGAMVIALIA